MRTYWRGKVVVVTGASAGIGRAVVRELARRGARIGLLARGRDGLEAARREVHDLGGEALVVPTDVADADQVEAAAEAVEAAFGPIDVWINNAMVSVFAPVADLEPAEVRRVTEVTYLGQVHGTLAALRRMRKRNRGVIVQVGSALAFRGIPLQSAYCAAKHAVEGFTESLRTELMHEGSDVELTIVHLPGTNTPQFTWSRSRMPRRARPVAPVFAPEIAAEAIVWAAEHPRRQVLVGSPTLRTIWGNRAAPGLVDRYLARNGYEAQMTDDPEDPDRPDNLWDPLPGDHGARGPFDEEQVERSLQVWATTHRKSLAAILVGAAAAAAVAWSRRRPGGLARGVEAVRREARRFPERAEAVRRQARRLPERAEAIGREVRREARRLPERARELRERAGEFREDLHEVRERRRHPPPEPPRPTGWLMIPGGVPAPPEPRDRHEEHEGRAKRAAKRAAKTMARRAAMRAAFSMFRRAMATSR